jgi:hypothetical protein
MGLVSIGEATWWLLGVKWFVQQNLCSLKHTYPYVCGQLTILVTNDLAFKCIIYDTVDDSLF